MSFEDPLVCVSRSLLAVGEVEDLLIDLSKDSDYGTLSICSYLII